MQLDVCAGPGHRCRTSPRRAVVEDDDVARRSASAAPSSGCAAVLGPPAVLDQPRLADRPTARVDPSGCPRGRLRRARGIQAARRRGPAYAPGRGSASPRRSGTREPVDREVRSSASVPWAAQLADGLGEPPPPRIRGAGASARWSPREGRGPSAAAAAPRGGGQRRQARGQRERSAGAERSGGPVPARRSSCRRRRGARRRGAISVRPRRPARRAGDRSAPRARGRAPARRRLGQL